MRVGTSALLAIGLTLLLAAPSSAASPPLVHGDGGVALTFHLTLRGDVPAFSGVCPPRASFCGEVFTVVVLEVAGPRGIGPSGSAFCVPRRPVSGPARPAPVPTTCQGGVTYTLGLSKAAGYPAGQTVRYRIMRFGGVFVVQPGDADPAPADILREGVVTLTGDLTIDTIYSFSPAGRGQVLPMMPDTGSGGRAQSAPARERRPE